jgi:hypothetical protein
MATKVCDLDRESRILNSNARTIHNHAGSVYNKDLDVDIRDVPVPAVGVGHELQGLENT